MECRCSQTHYTRILDTVSISLTRLIKRYPAWNRIIFFQFDFANVWNHESFNMHIEKIIEKKQNLLNTKY